MLSTKEMQEAEERAVQAGTSRLELMERAGNGVANEIAQRLPKGKKILFLCLHGNNGGDGFVAARYLAQDYTVHVWFLGNKEKLAEEAKVNFGKLSTVLFVKDPDLASYDCLVDAMLGTGATGTLREQLREIAQEWKKTDALKIAVDIPTGVHPDTGEKEDWFVPDLIVTFHDLKAGLKGLEDKTVVVDIGL